MIGFGQAFIKEYNTIPSAYEFGASIKQTSDGGYIILGGSFQVVDSLNINLVRTDASGNYLWHRNTGGPNQDHPGGGNETVHQTLDGGFITLGTYHFSSNVSNTSRVWLIKRDAGGNQEWEKKFDADSCSPMSLSLEPTSDGGYIIYSAACDNRVWLIKTDSQGDTLWTKTHPSPFNIGGFAAIGGDIEQTNDGGYIITGMKMYVPNPNTPNGFDTPPAIMKLDPQGNMDWTQSYNIPTYFATMNSVEQTTDGGFILSGGFWKADSIFFIGGTFAIKTDNSGNEVWSKFDTTSLAPFPSFFMSTDIKQTNDGGYIFHRSKTGSSYPNFGGLTSQHIVITKLFPSGLDDWSTIFQNYQDKIIVYPGRSIEQTSDGGYIMTGALIDTLTSDYHTLLIKTDGNGNVTSTFNIPTLNTSKGELLKIIDLLGKETKETNQPLIYIYDDGTVEKRIIIE